MIQHALWEILVTVSSSTRDIGDMVQRNLDIWNQTKTSTTSWVGKIWMLWQLFRSTYCTIFLIPIQKKYLNNYGSNCDHVLKWMVTSWKHFIEWILLYCQYYNHCLTCTGWNVQSFNYWHDPMNWSAIHSPTVVYNESGLDFTWPAAYFNALLPEDWLPLNGV